MRYLHHLLTASCLRRAVYLLAVACGCLLLDGSRPPTQLESVLASGKLTVLSRNGTTTYYEGRAGLTGFEYTLASAFADSLGVKLEIREEESIARTLRGVNNGRAQLAASGLTVTPAREQLVRFGMPYMTITEQVIYRHGSPAPRSVEDLIGKRILVIANSSHAERLRELQLQYPQLTWQEETDVEMFDLIEMVHRGDIDYTIVDSNAYAINRNIFPKALVAFDISGPENLGWAFAKSKDSSLYDAAQRFLAEYTADGRLAEVRNEYFGEFEVVDRNSALVLSRRIENRLPRYRHLMESAAAELEIEWELLAAVSYQESHWDPKATSRTGVRGLMMLTSATAREMGVTNRIDAEQSMHGGARYLIKIYNRIPDRIQGNDRLWMALAAYNIGLGHLEDARVLTAKRGANPDVWEDVKASLPLLANRKYYRTAKHGYARGWEAVSYVENIRSYYTVLVWHSQMEARRLALQGADIPTLSLNDNRRLNLTRL